MIYIRESKANAEKWDNNLKKAKRCHYQQMWSYGDAARSSNKKPVRYEIMKENHVIGQAQGIRRSFLGGFFSHTDVYGGPVWLDKNISDAEKIHAFSALLKTIRRNFRHVITWMPAQPATPLNDHLFKALALKKVALGYQTAFLDLTQSTDMILKKVNSSWKKIIKKPKNYICHFSTTANDCDMIITQYQHMKEQRQFKGPSAAFIQKLIQEKTCRFLYASILENNILLAGSLFLLHGTTATYFISYNSEKGRKLSLMHYLVWQSLKELKEKHAIHVFDWGGYLQDVPKHLNEHSAGIDQFKAGLGAKIFNYVGIYVR